MIKVTERKIEEIKEMVAYYGYSKSYLSDDEIQLLLSCGYSSDSIYELICDDYCGYGTLKEAMIQAKKL